MQQCPPLQNVEEKLLSFSLRGAGSTNFLYFVIVCQPVCLTEAKQNNTRFVPSIYTSRTADREPWPRTLMSALIIQFSSRSDDGGLPVSPPAPASRTRNRALIYLILRCFSCSFPHLQLLAMMLSSFLLLLLLLPPRKKENLRSHGWPFVEARPKIRNALQDHLQRTMTVTSFTHTRREVFRQVVQISFLIPEDRERPNRNSCAKTLP